MSDLSVPLAAPPLATGIDWRDIPVFIVNRNRCAALQRLVAWLLAGGTRRVVILDNASTYPPLLDYYAALPEGARLMPLDQNFGPYVFWQQGVHKVIDTPYVMTDSDVVPAECCPADLIARLLSVLQRYPDVTKVGPALRIDDIPDGYVEADTVRKWESQFWEHPVAPGVFAAPIDTTFALYPAHADFSNDARSLRLGHPFIAEHTPWYAQEGALSEEERYYREHTSATFSNWSVAKKDSWVRRSERVAGFEHRVGVLHIDGGREYIPGWINAGSGDGRFDIEFDLRRCREQRLALHDDMVDGIHLSHVLEGVRDPQALFSELYRVAKPGARLFIRVAHGARPGAWQDPAQQRAWTEGSFSYFGQPSQPDSAAYSADWRLDAVNLVTALGAAAAPADGVTPNELVVMLTAIKPARPRRGHAGVSRVETQLTADDRFEPGFVKAEATELAEAAAVPALEPGTVALVPVPAPASSIRLERGASMPAVRLGLPWWLPHYEPMNGGHPLVQSFVRGNGATAPVVFEAKASVSQEQVKSVLLRVAQQCRVISHEETAPFIESLNVQGQWATEAQAQQCDALFLHTTPLYAGTRPWVFHFESFPSLFMPFMYTGKTRDVDLTSQDFFKLVGQALASSSCRSIFSHMRGSLEILQRTFGSAAIAAKCHHVPLGIACCTDEAATAKFDPSRPLRILFTNSLHNEPSSFYLRGGHHLLNAFARLRRHLPTLELTVLSSVPNDLTERFSPEQMVGVTWIDARVDEARLAQLYLDHHFFALPAAGLHSFSLLRALAHGCVPIVSDAPGYEEYTQDIQDSVLTVRGVREMVYRDEPSGWISDCYVPFKEHSQALAGQIHDLVLAHADMSALREMALRNLAHSRRHYRVDRSHEAFNRMLAAGLNLPSTSAD